MKAHLRIDPKRKLIILVTGITVTGLKGTVIQDRNRLLASRHQIGFYSEKWNKDDFRVFDEELKAKVGVDYKMDRLKRSGFELTLLGRNIRAVKGSLDLSGSINKVYKSYFGY